MNANKNETPQFNFEWIISILLNIQLVDYIFIFIFKMIFEYYTSNSYRIG